MKNMLTVEDVRGIRKQRFDWDDGELIGIVGRNGSGKTSLAYSLAAVLALNPNPKNVKMTEAKRVYLRKGSTVGSATLERDGDVVSQWHPNRAEVTGNTPICCDEMVGAVDFIDAKEPVNLLQSLLLPPFEEILRQVEEHLSDMVDGKTLEGIMKEIRQRGWEDAQKIFRDRALRDRQQWEKITGDTWGDKKAVDWRPAEWEAEWEGVTIQQAERDLQDARDALSSLQGAVSVTEAQIEEAQDAKEEAKHLKADFLPKLKEVEITASGNLDVAENNLSKAVRDHSSAVSRLRELEGIEGKPCPNCGSPLMQHKSDFVEFDVDKHQEAIRATKNEIVDTGEERTRRAKEMKEAKEQHSSAQQNVARMEAEIRRLNKQAELADRTASPEDNEEKLNQYEADAEKAIKRRDMIEKAIKAESMYQSRQDSVAVQKALGTSGIRAKMLKGSTGRFQGALNLISEITGWPAVTIHDKDLLVGELELPPNMLCKSEQWIVQAMMQLVCALIWQEKVSEGPVVILDHSDDLDKEMAHKLHELTRRIAENKGITIIYFKHGDPMKDAEWRQLHMGLEVEAK